MSTASPCFSAPRSGCSRIRTTTTKVGPGVQWALRHLPFYGRWYRFLLFWPGCDKGLDAARVDPDYPDQQKAVSEINEITRIMFTEWITSQVGDDPEPAGQGGARLPGHRQAHPAGQRQLADDADPRQRRTGADGDRPHRVRRGRHRGRHTISGRHHRLRHRISGQQDAVADDHSRAGRRDPQRALG